MSIVFILGKTQHFYEFPALLNPINSIVVLNRQKYEFVLLDHD
jgi:hypothetical protein